MGKGKWETAADAIVQPLFPFPVSPFPAPRYPLPATRFPLPASRFPRPLPETIRAFRRMGNP